MFQAQCDGNVESLGRRRRRREAAALNASSTEGEEDMSISQEILVLDFNDENKGRLPAVPSQLGGTPSADFGEDPSVSALGQQCSGRGTLLALSVSCALLTLLYVSTLSFYCARSWFLPKKGFANA
ncbi:hypothetical protein B566_EDAN016568 [Ephemera danica]|nr:hypothetical protein B566_EDAN016568 [Ephemera danica]